MKKTLLLLTLILVFFGSMSFVCSADDQNVNGIDIAENYVGIESTSNSASGDTPGSTPSPVSTAASVNNDIIVTVSHTEAVHGKPITFTITAKYQNGTAVANWKPAFVLSANSDKSYPKEGHAVNSDATNAQGVLTITWKGNPGWFDYYDLVISDGLDSSHNPTGKIYYNQTKLLDFTIKRDSTKIDISISKPNVYEGEMTEVTAYVTSNGNPVSIGYLEWTYAEGKTVRTLVQNGISIFNYNSYKLGHNPISVTYIGYGNTVQIPGLIVSDVVATKSFAINVKAAPDLVIAKVVRSGNKYKVTIKNIGNGASTATKLKMGYAKKSRTINIHALAPGQSRTYTVNFFKYSQHKKFNKYAWVNPTKSMHDKNHANDRLVFKSKVAYGLAADLRIGKIVRSGNNYVITIKNQGNLAASAFKFRMWYGTQKKPKGLIDHTVKRFGQFGNRLPPGVSIALTVPYHNYKTHSKFFKFVQVNHNKKLPELKYTGNLKKFKV